MKKLILNAITLVLSVLHLNAQSDPYQHVLDRITKTYNAGSYKDFYAMLSPEFKAQQNEKELSDFLKNNVYAYYGPIKKISFLEEKLPFRHYKATCKKGDLELMLACTAQQEISGLVFQPYVERSREVKKAVASTNPLSTAFDRELDSLVKPYAMAAANAGLSIGISDRGEQRFYHYGEIKKGSHQLPDNGSLYEIGSITKTFTGLLLAKAIEEGKAGADDDIRRYLPASCKHLEYKGKPLTLIQLANHTSGLPRIPDNLTSPKGFKDQDPYSLYSRQMLMDYLSGLKPKVMPGTVSDYSNTGMALLGLILADVYGKSYAGLVKEKITGPLKMEHTCKDVPENELSAFCTGYNEEGDETSHWTFACMEPCGGLRSSMEDMMRYLQANLEEADPAILAAHRTTFQSGKYNGVGMAWMKQQSLSGEETCWHNGATYGFSGFIAFMKSKNIGIVVLSNSGNSVDTLAIQLLKLLRSNR